VENYEKIGKGDGLGNEVGSGVSYLWRRY